MTETTSLVGSSQDGRLLAYTAIQYTLSVWVAQRYRALDYQAAGRGFKSRSGQKSEK